MSNKSQSSTENLRSVRWRMHLPREIVDLILDLSIAEERDPGAIMARWVKEHFNDRAQKEKKEL